MIIAAVDTIMTLSKAVDIATGLNADDDWTYAVVKIDANPGMAKVSITDEDGEFVGYL
jgi:hypothetical protein